MGEEERHSEREEAKKKTVWNKGKMAHKRKGKWLKNTHNWVHFQLSPFYSPRRRFTWSFVWKTHTKKREVKWLFPPCAVFPVWLSFPCVLFPLCFFHAFFVSSLASFSSFLFSFLLLSFSSSFFLSSSFTSLFLFHSLDHFFLCNLVSLIFIFITSSFHLMMEMKQRHVTLSEKFKRRLDKKIKKLLFLFSLLISFVFVFFFKKASFPHPHQSSHCQILKE